MVVKPLTVLGVLVLCENKVMGVLHNKRSLIIFLSLFKLFFTFFSFVSNSLFNQDTVIEFGNPPMGSHSSTDGELG